MTLRRPPDPDVMIAEQAAAEDIARELGLQDLTLIWMPGEAMLTFKTAGPPWFAALAAEVLRLAVSCADQQTLTLR